MYFVMLYHLLMSIPVITLYFLYGLMWSNVASMAAVGLLILGLKLARKKVEPLLYVELFFMLAFNLPGIILQNGLLLKLSEPISGLFAGAVFGIAALAIKTPLLKWAIPKEIREKPEVKKALDNIPDKPLKKIEYIWAVEMIASAGLSLAIALLFPTSVWFIAKYVIGPVLSCLAVAASGYTLYSAFRWKPRTYGNDHEYFPRSDDPQIDTDQLEAYKSTPPLVYTQWCGKKSEKLTESLAFEAFTRRNVLEC